MLNESEELLSEDPTASSGPSARSTCCQDREGSAARPGYVNDAISVAPNGEVAAITTHGEDPTTIHAWLGRIGIDPEDIPRILDLFGTEGAKSMQELLALEEDDVGGIVQGLPLAKKRLIAKAFFKEKDVQAEKFVLLGDEQRWDAWPS